MGRGRYAGRIYLLEAVEIREDVTELPGEELRLGLGQLEVRQQRYPFDICACQGSHA